MQNKIYFLIEGAYSTPHEALAQYLINEVGFKLEEIHMNYLLDERPGDYKQSVTKKRFRDAVEEKGLDHIKEDLDEIQPTHIVFVGKNITEHFLNKTMSNLNSRLEDYNLLGTEYRTTGVYSYKYYQRDNKFGKLHSQLTFVANSKLEDKFEPTTKYKIIKSMEEFDTLIDYVKETGVFCFDYETTGFDWFSKDQHATILSVSFNHGFSYIIPLYHREPIFEGYDDIVSSIEKNEVHKKPKLIGFEEKLFSDEDIEEIFEILNDEVFNNRKVRKIAHNLKFDLHWMKRYGVKDYDGRFDDTMLMSHVLNENIKHGLKELTKLYFPKFTGYEEELKLFSWESTPLEILSKYAAIDTDVTLRLSTLFEDLLINDRLKDEDALYQLERYASKYNSDLAKREKTKYILYVLYRNLVMPSFFALFDAEHHGAKIDSDLIKQSIKRAEYLLDKKFNELNGYPEVRTYVKKKREEVHQAEIDKLNKKIEARFEKSGKSDDRYIKKYKDQIAEIKIGKVNLYEDINFNSPAQLSDLLFGDNGFGFPLFRDPRSGELKATTAREFLQEIDHPFINILFAYRSISKMLSTYYQGILDKLDDKDFIHSSFLQHGTVTGRLSSRNPNLQNIPSRLKFDDAEAEECLKMVKKFFTTIDDTYYTVQADYSQAELRVIANFSGDKKMTETYVNDIDIHSLTAASTLDISLEEFYKLDPKEQKKNRFGAKGTNFGLVYDISVDGYKAYLKSQYGIVISRDEAQDHYDKFFRTYTELKGWHDDYREFARITGYVRTLFGRKRNLEHIKNNFSSSQARAADERYSINNPIQGTSGEYAIFSAAILRHRLPKDCIFFNTVHDSVFFYIKKDKLQYCLDIIHDACENPPIEKYFGIKPGTVTMKMDIEISEKSWGDMVELDEYFSEK